MFSPPSSSFTSRRRCVTRCVARIDDFSAVLVNLAKLIYGFKPGWPTAATAAAAGVAVDLEPCVHDL